MFQILVEDGPGAGRKITVTERATIGRLKACDIPLPDGSVSRQHARLVVQNDKLLVRDLASANGTTINGQTIEAGTAAIGDTIGIGNCVLRVESTRAAPATPPPSSPPSSRSSSPSATPSQPPPAEATAAKTSAPKTAASGARPAAASGVDVGGVQIKARKKTLQYSEYATGPKEKGLLGNDVDQQSGWVRFAIYAGIAVLMLVVIFASGKIVDFIMPGRGPDTTVEEDYEALDETELEEGTDGAPGK